MDSDNGQQLLELLGKRLEVTLPLEQWIIAAKAIREQCCNLPQFDELISRQEAKLSNYQARPLATWA